MSLKSQLSSDLSVFFDTDDFAITVTYGGNEIDAIVDYGEHLDEQTGTMLAVCDILVKASDVASPAYRDTVVIGSDTWKVRNILEGDSFVWKLRLYRDERPLW